MSQTVYNETLVFFVNLVKSTAANTLPMFSGQLGIGTNTSSKTDTQIGPNANYVGGASVQILAIFCDGPLTITYNNGQTSYTTTINSILILPGVTSGFTLTNSGINAVNCSIVTA